MPFKVHVDVNLPKDAMLVFPISLGEPHHTGGKLKALLKFARDFQKRNPKSQVTILVADTLRRWNVGLDAAKGMGNHFITENANDLDGLAVLRWDEWIEKYKEKYDLATKLIDDNYVKDRIFCDKIRKTYESSQAKKGKDLESSVRYQKEEYAVMLTMKGMYLGYPAKSSTAWSYLYRLFPELMPAHLSIRRRKKKC